LDCSGEKGFADEESTDEVLFLIKETKTFYFLYTFPYLLKKNVSWYYKIKVVIKILVKVFFLYEYISLFYLPSEKYVLRNGDYEGNCISFLTKS